MVDGELITLEDVLTCINSPRYRFKVSQIATNEVRAIFPETLKRNSGAIVSQIALCRVMLLLFYKSAKTCSNILLPKQYLVCYSSRKITTPFCNH